MMGTAALLPKNLYKYIVLTTLCCRMPYFINIYNDIDRSDYVIERTLNLQWFPHDRYKKIFFAIDNTLYIVEMEWIIGPGKSVINQLVLYDP